MICATASLSSPHRCAASSRAGPFSSILTRFLAFAVSRASSMVFASQIVHVTSEAKASPIITAFTTMSAFMNMPHGDRSCGSSELERWPWRSLGLSRRGRAIML